MSGNNTSPQALYQQAKSYVQSKLLSGEWKPGDMIPSEKRCASSSSGLLVFPIVYMITSENVSFLVRLKSFSPSLTCLL